MSKILIVDDEKEILELVDIFLRKQGYEVVKFNNGEDALAFMDEDAGIDLVILDIRMPGIDGGTVLERLRRKEKELPVIFLTGSVGGQPVKVKADAMFMKPIDLNDLSKKVKELLSKKEKSE